MYVLELQTVGSMRPVFMRDTIWTWKSASSLFTSDIRIVEESKSKFQRLQSHVSFLKLQSAGSEHESPHGTVKLALLDGKTTHHRPMGPSCLRLTPTVSDGSHHPTIYPLWRSALPACEAGGSRCRSAHLLLWSQPPGRCFPGWKINGTCCTDPMASRLWPLKNAIFQWG